MICDFCNKPLTTEDKSIEGKNVCKNCWDEATTKMEANGEVTIDKSGRVKLTTKGKKRAIKEVSQ